jgi:NAD-dependent deacetylase
MLNDLKNLIDRSKRAVVFTGAGISTESGIPDFRSPGGIWSKHRVIYFDEFVRSRDARIEAWTRLFAGRDMLRNAQPNAGHRAVAKLVDLGKVTHVITQNVDGLHQAAGVPASKVIEVHGNSTYAKCLACGQRHEFDDIEPAFKETGEPPSCAACGGVVKSATISFGQAMPEEEMERAAEARPRLRPVPRDRLHARRLSGRGPADCRQTQRREIRDSKPRPDRTRPHGRPGLERRNWPHSGEGRGRKLTGLARVQWGC